ncbi:MAG: HAD hydrolase family protein, partial [Acidobacteriota bacterium]|nr:HAD hydrolase family protein [Acidobacteriota bacterium]
GELHFVDGVVGENGAVLHFPESDHTTLLAPGIPRSFLDELTVRGVPFRAGQSLVDTDAVHAPVILEVIRALELPLVLIFNKGRVMTLPQGVSKGTGLHAALAILRLSARNTLAIGDAENDHELLRLAEVGVAVPWASAALRETADLTLAGDGTAAVAAYLRDLAETGRLPPAAHGRRRLLLGYGEDGREFSLAARGRNVLIAGDTKSGKSWVAGLLCEQLILHGYCLCVIDPEGDYRSLEALPGVTILGGEDPPPTPRDLIRALRYPDRSVVIDLSRVPQDGKLAYIRSALAALNRLRRQTGLPHHIVIDEAHYFLHEDAAGLLDLERNGYTVITYCASRLPRRLLESTEIVIVTCQSNPAEIDALFTLCEKRAGTNREDWDALARLRPGQAIALPITTESEGRLRLLTIARRLTPHVRHRQKYVDVPVSERRGFVFSTTPLVRARTLRQFVAELEHQATHTLEPFVERGDFSRWVRDVFGDHALAAELQAIESGDRGPAGPGTIPALTDAIRARYDLREEVDGELKSPQKPGSLD